MGDRSPKKIEKPKRISNDSSFILKSNKTSGNYSILRQYVKNNKTETMRIKYNIYGAYLPFGCEEYNDNSIINAVIDDSTNINHNLMVTINKICKAFENLKDSEVGKNKYGLNDKEFFSFLKEYDQNNVETTKQNTVLQSQQSHDNNCNDKIKKYQLRLYLKYGAKINHAKLVGELSATQLKGKKCNLDIELGSMWVNEKISQYGINVYITHITVLN